MVYEVEQGEGVSLLSSFPPQHCPSYRLQWWSCPGATQWGTPFSKEELSERAPVGDSRNPSVQRFAAVSIDTNNKLVSLLSCVYECVISCSSASRRTIIISNKLQMESYPFTFKVTKPGRNARLA